ncbi:MAG: hypothetical protein M1826_007220 [Phylliscum demangeonii]|nr:MAG: hypothetical protein M1826_007220 [Phylliscum demangeonii]
MHGKDQNAAAVDAYQIEVETAALLRAAEDLLSLSRSLKEAWLFGRLRDMTGDDRLLPAVERDAVAVGAMVQRLLRWEEREKL